MESGRTFENLGKIRFGTEIHEHRQLWNQSKVRIIFIKTQLLIRENLKDIGDDHGPDAD